MPSLRTTSMRLIALVLVAGALLAPVRARAQRFDEDARPKRRSSTSSSGTVPTGFIVAPDDEEEEEERPAPKPVRKPSRPAPARVQQDEEEEEEEPVRPRAPAPPPRRSSGGISITEESTAAPSTIRMDGEGDAQGRPLGGGKGLGLVPAAPKGGSAVFRASPADEEDEEEDEDERPAPRTQPTRRSSPAKPAPKAAPPPRDTRAPTGFIVPHDDEELDERPSSRAASPFDDEPRRSAPASHPSILERQSEPQVNVLGLPQEPARPRSTAPIVIEEEHTLGDDTFIDASGKPRKTTQKPQKITPEQKIAPRPEPKAEPIVAAPPPRIEPKIEPRPEPKPAPRYEPEPEPIVEAPPRRIEPKIEPKPEPKIEPKRTPIATPQPEEEAEQGGRLLTGGNRSAPPAADPFEKLDRELRQLEGKPEPKAEPPPARRPLVEAPKEEPKVAPVPEKRREEFQEPELAAKPLDTPPPPPSEIARDPSRMGLSFLAGAGPLVASDPRSGYTVDFAYGVQAAWNPSFAGRFALDVGLFRATRSDGTPFVTVDSAYTHVATRVLYLKEQRKNLFAGFGAGLLLTHTAATYIVVDGARQEPSGSQMRAGGDASVVAGYRLAPFEVRVDLRTLLRGGLRLDFLPTVSVGASF